MLPLREKFLKKNAVLTINLFGKTFSFKTYLININYKRLLDNEKYKILII